jgi:hypothetical protein
VIGRYRILCGREYFPIGRGRILPYEVNSGIEHIHNNEQEHELQGEGRKNKSFFKQVA